MDNEEDRLSFFQWINHNQEQLGIKLPQINTVPQIFVDGNRIGGYAELLKKQETILKGRGGALTKQSETYKPFYYPIAVDLSIRHEKAHWIEDEVDLSDPNLLPELLRSDIFNSRILKKEFQKCILHYQVI